MRRIVEGLGLGLARRAARKLVPVVLTLGSGPSGFPRNLSGRRPKLPRQPRRGRVARARSRNFDAGSWPVGLLETTFRATAEASATAMANPRRRTRALRYFGAGGWPVGLPETIFRATAKASERCKAGGSWTPTAMANPRRRTRALRYFGRASRNNFPGDGRSFRDSHGKPAPSHYFGAGGWPVGLPETIFRATAKASATASLALASVVLALGVGPTGFPKQVSERRKAGGSWTPTAMANPRRRTRALRYFGAGAGPDL